MNHEDKELLLKDLCARLPYKVKVNEATHGDFTLIGLTNERVFTTCEVEGCHNDFPIENIKPYLFPMSGMTEEERRTLDSKCNGVEMMNRLSGLKMFDKAFDWLDKNGFDYRGLIPKGLAIDATGLY